MTIKPLEKNDYDGNQTIICKGTTTTNWLINMPSEGIAAACDDGLRIRIRNTESFDTYFTDPSSPMYIVYSVEFFVKGEQVGDYPVTYYNNSWTDKPALYTITYQVVDHDYQESSIIKEATCTEDGIVEKKCSNCGDTITEALSAKGHSYSDWTITKEATCIEEGSESIHCAVCDAIDESTVRSIPVLTVGWIEDENGWKYLKSDGTYPKSKFETIGGKTYYFNASEYRVSGLQTISSKKYYFSTDGVMQTRWQTVDGEKYYFDKDGAAHIGWLQLGDKWYYFRLTGVMHTGMLKKDGIYYYLEKSGVRHSGWLQVNGKLYYFKANGQMLTGWLQKSGKMY